jgi:NADPH:quinone reductase-like Zn-dependent oxidoreductase
MKAWVLEKYGAPEKAFALKEVPDPVAHDGEVLIRSEGFGLNYADVMARKGLYREAPKPPCVVGYETVGTVIALGAGAPAGLLGKRVTAVCRFGGYAELVATDHRACTEIPAAMDVGTATAMTTQGCTAWYMSMIAWPLRKDMRVLIHSAAGGVGNLLVQIALSEGCEVFAVASGPQKMEALQQLGVQHVIDRSRSDHATEVRAILGKEKLDASFNAVGGSTFKKDLALIGSGGALVMYGGSERGNGPFSTLAFVWRMGLVIPIFLMMTSKSLIGVNMLRLSTQQPMILAESLRAQARAVAEGRLKPHVHEIFPASDLPKAHALLESGRSLGKVALKW